MKYKCDKCDYESDYKSNLNRHINSMIHNQSDEELQKQYVCECGKFFKFPSGLSRHKKECNNGLQGQVVTLQHQVDNLCRQLTEYVSITKQSIVPDNTIRNNQTINNNQTYNISIKNCIQQNYPDAPALEGLSDYAKIMYDRDSETDENISMTPDDFIDTLAYEYNNNHLYKYLGDFIIKYYKKEDPAEQSMWTSDTSRLTYIIKELLSNKKSIWNHDYKGIKTKEYIIAPLLKYIKGYIDDYWINQLHNYKIRDLDKINKIHNIYQALYKIKKDIENDVLGHEIVRYIAPHFKMDSKTIYKI